ncbi:HET-domain-containing protein, partial [Cenococcum geophilum]
ALQKGSTPKILAPDLSGRAMQVGPARLIDIGTDLENQEIKLIEVGTAMPEYFTLSYCWGGKGFLKSDSKTLGRWKKNIPWMNLPKTFKDAVAITRRLGYRYLWIDSLCTVQDGVHDWQVESSKMAEVYENGVLNISAALGPDAEYGCFHDRYFLCDQKTKGIFQDDLKSFPVQLKWGEPVTAFNLHPSTNVDGHSKSGS